MVLSKSCETKGGEGVCRNKHASLPRSLNMVWVQVIRGREGEGLSFIENIGAIQSAEYAGTGVTYYCERISMKTLMSEGAYMQLYKFIIPSMTRPFITLNWAIPGMGRPWKSNWYKIFVTTCVPSSFITLSISLTFPFHNFLFRTRCTLGKMYS